MSQDATVTVGLSPDFPKEYAHLLADVSPRIRLVHLVEGRTPDEAGEIEVLAWWQFSRSYLTELAARLPRLRWMQSPAAGVGDQRPHDIVGKHVIITSAAGVYADMVAEHALMLLLALYRRLPELLEQQRQERWEDLGARTLAGQTLGIIGAGGIGRAAARMAKVFGMRTLGIRRGRDPISDVDQTLHREQLPRLLAESDAVLLAMPLTPDTDGMVNAGFLRSMKRTAVLINIARGRVVDTDALVDALRNGSIAGAGLDVTDPEPLPQGHPLWHLPGVIITPHHANPRLLSRVHAVQRFADNLRRYLNDEPLIAVVDPERGY
jgi:phosphoglycerate dehydrogenase-like enzyme